MILDTHSEVFVWMGQCVDTKEKQKAFEIGQVRYQGLTFVFLTFNYRPTPSTDCFPTRNTYNMQWPLKVFLLMCLSIKSLKGLNLASSGHTSPGIAQDLWYALRYLFFYFKI